jgi:type III pantothenate kinase
MNLIIDIGNTRVKYAVFHGEEQIYSTKSNNLSRETVHSIVNEYPIQKSIVSSVRANSTDEAILSELQHLVSFNHSTSIPINNKYATPETLGLDRLAAAVGAYKLNPGNFSLVFDFGTALTIDFIDENANYLGGNISPGLNTRFKALNQFTGKLPLIESFDKINLIGTNTHGAIANGVVNGMVFEVDSYIDRMKSTRTDIKVIATGGDAKRFDNLLKNTIFVVENLVAQGLNSILNYNA